MKKLEVEVKPGFESGEAQERMALAQRVAASRPFARAPQLKDFLLFIVERALRDGGAGINETEIGRHVLRRGQADFDPNTDNIVRVQARHLRQKIEEYFAGEGIHEPLLLTIPKGSYVPKFVPRESQPPSQPGAPAQPEIRARRWALPLIALLIGGAAVWLLVRHPAPGEAAPQASADALWSAFARTGRRTSVVLSDSSVSVVQNVLRRQVTLEGYLSAGYPKDLLAEAGEGRAAQVLEEITRHPYTSLNSAIVASRLQLAARRAGVEATLRFPRDITLREFKSENFVLIGSRRSVPWMELLEDQLNFVLRGDPHSLDFYMSNKSPLAGELPAYKPEPANANTTYASLALLPNASGTGLIFCFQGLSGMANEAAEELIGNPRTSPLQHLLNSQPPGALPRIEILIRATGVSGAPAKVAVVAIRNGASKR